MEITIQKMKRLVAAAVIVLTGATWADTMSSTETRTVTETTSVSVNREVENSTHVVGRLVRPTSNDEEDATLEAQPNFFMVMFDANGGVCSEIARSVERDTVVGSLPEATREGWTLVGWYTEKDAGYRVREYTVVKENATYYAHWKSDYGCDSSSDAGKWYTLRSEAIAAARKSGKKIFLICGRDTCHDAKTTMLSCEEPTVNPELTAKCVLWYSNYDTQESETRRYLPLESFTFPVVCVIDPDDPEYYIKRATGEDYGGALSGVDVLAFIADIPYPPKPASSASGSSKGLSPSDGGYTGQYADAKTLHGAVYDGNDMVGIVELKLGKVNVGNNMGRVSGAVTLLDGKRYAIKSQRSAVGGSAPISLEVKNLGTLDVTINGSRFSGTLGGWRVQSANVGGNWKSSTVKVSVDADDLSAIPGTVLDSLLPDGEKGSSSGNRWTFALAASVRWAKPKSDEKPVVLDAESGKGLIVDTSRNRTNLSGINLSYTAKNGTFKGSFKVYALEGSGNSTRLKKYTVKVVGVVVNGVGYGSATCGRPEINWSITVR